MLDFHRRKMENCVGTLQEFCVKSGYPNPVYEVLINDILILTVYRIIGTIAMKSILEVARLEIFSIFH